MKSKITGLARTVKLAAPFELFPKEKSIIQVSSSEDALKAVSLEACKSPCCSPFSERLSLLKSLAEVTRFRYKP